MRLMFIGALFTHPQEESTWNKKNYFFKVLAGKSAQQKQVPKGFGNVTCDCVEVGNLNGMGWAQQPQLLNESE